MFEILSKLPRNPISNSVFRCYCSKAIKPKPTILQSDAPKRRSYGQPTFETHPHLLAENEITPSITKFEYQERRHKLLDLVAEYARKRNKDIKRHLIVIPSATKQYMSEKIPYVFRQNTDFLYLTGCQEPDSCLVLTAGESASEHFVTLFVRGGDSHSEKWDGPRTGPEDAVHLFGVDQALPMTELENFLQIYMKSNRSSTLWYDFMSPVQVSVHKVMCDHLNEIMSKVWESPKAFVHKLRLYKSQAEVDLMQKSCDVASEAFIKAMSTAEPGISEHQIFAQIDYECRMRGAEFLAYPPVVAGGDRATIIHYINNNQIVKRDEMVLVDAGCEFHGYSSDITRTWPVRGYFSEPQRALYEAVLNVQVHLIDLLKELPTLDHLYDKMCVLLGKELKRIGLISSSVENQALLKAVYDFCPHHVSHYLGMDVHDTGLIPRNIPLQPGMIVTVEPGVYIDKKNRNVPRDFQGLGVRIEDDVLITENGPVVLSALCPKSVYDIENLVKQKK